MGGNKKHKFRIIIWLILALILLLAGAGIFAFFKAEKYINQNLSRIVKEKSDGLYTLSFSNIEFNIHQFSVSISDVSLQADPVKTKSILQSNPDKVFYSFESPKIEIKGIAPLRWYNNGQFYCSDISIEKPRLELSGKEIIASESGNSLKRFFIEMRPLFKKYVKSVWVNNIDFNNANYQFYNSANDSAQISNARQISINIKNFRTDSTLISRDNHFFASDDILVKMRRFQNILGDSLHILTIDSLEYSLQSSDINAYNFKLNYKEKNSNRSLYDVYVPRAYIKSKSITRFDFSDSLKVEFLQFENPKIRFYKKENPRQIKLEDIRNFELHSLIRNQFSTIKIDSFVLHNSNLEFYRQPDFTKYQQKFDSLTISLSHFSLDSVSAEDSFKLFYADNLEMLVGHYHLRLEDDSHNFFADSMFFSTYKNTLGVKNIRVSPIENAAPRTEVNLSCKRLNINEVNLKTLYHTRVLPTRQIQICKPNVHLKYHTNIKKSSDKKQAGLLFELVTAYTKGVYADKVKIENGFLNIQNVRKKWVQGYFETGFDFDLNNFALDSASISNSDKLFYASDFDLGFNNYQMKLIDNLHKISVDSVLIQSKNRNVEIKKLHLRPVIKNVTDSVMQKYQRSELFNIYVPKIKLWGVNLRDAFFYNQLHISKFSIINPKIYFENFGALRQKQNRNDSLEIYDLIFNYISDFDIKEINTSGNFSWVNHTRKGKTTSFDNDFEASLYNFRLNENELKKQRLLFSDNFDITVKDQLFQLSDSVHNLRAGEINLSTNKRKVTIKNALLYPVITAPRYKSLSTTFQVSIPTLSISDLDFLQAWYSKKLVLNELVLNAPRFQVYTKEGSKKSLDFNRYTFPLPAFISSLNINNLKVNRAEVITYETRGLDHFAGANFTIDMLLPNVTIRNNLNNRVHINTQNLLATIHNFKTPLGNTHDLEIKKVDFNREKKSVLLEGLKINPFTKTNQQNTYTISSPKLSFTNFDISSALSENSFNFDQINISNPSIKIDITDSIKGDKLKFAQNLDLYPYIEPFVNEVHVKRLNLSRVNLNFNWFSKELINKEFDLNFDEINIGANYKASNILNSKRFELITHDLRTESKNGRYAFMADKLIYNSFTHNILFDKVQVKPLLKKEEYPRINGFQTDYLTASSDYIELKNINENRWVKDRILDAAEFKIGPAEVFIFRNKRFPFNTAQRPPWPQDLLKQIKQPFIFDSLVLSPSQLRYSELSDISDEPGFIDFNNIQFKTSTITNIPDEIRKNGNLKINASAKLLNQALLKTDFDFDLLNGYNHNAKGSLAPLNLNALNVMVSKSEPIKIESGRINRFDFDISFTGKQANGLLYFAYDNFEISVLGYKKDGFKKSKWASFWANSLLINKKNPKGNTLEPVKISFVRDEQRSIINYWWKSIFSGAKTVIGIENETKK